MRFIQVPNTEEEIGHTVVTIMAVLFVFARIGDGAQGSVEQSHNPTWTVCGDWLKLEILCLVCAERTKMDEALCLCQHIHYKMSYLNLGCQSFINVPIHCCVLVKQMG